MDLDELRAVQTRERATDGLQELRDSFYADVGTYIQDLRERRDEAAAEADDPFRNTTVNDLTDEIEIAEQVSEAIYERRIGKLVKQASLAAAGMPDDQSGLTTEEQDLYTDLVDRIKENKQGVLDVIAGDAPIETPDDGDGSPTDEDTSADAATADATDATGATESADTDDAPQPPPDAPPADAPAADAMGAGADEGDEGGDDSADDAEADQESAPAVDRTTVRVTSDVGEIFGVDEQEYSLYEDDVVQLPVENAEPLVQRDAAEKLER